MNLKAIYDLAQQYDASRKDRAVVLYKRGRKEAVERMEAAFASPAKSDDELYEVCDMLRATEGLAYAFFKCHGHSISDENQDQQGSRFQYKPKWAVSDMMRFGGSGSAPTHDRLLLTLDDWLEVQASLREQFPELIHWFRSDDEIA